MKRCFILAIFFLLFFSNISFAEYDSIIWNDYESGLIKAKEENKNVFIHFYSSWCSFCEKMNSSTFKSYKVIKYLTDNFVPIKVNVSNNVKLSNKYSVMAVPDNLFLTPNGEKIGNRPGYIDSNSLLKSMKIINKYNK